MKKDESQGSLKPSYVLGPLAGEGGCSKEGAKRDKISKKNHIRNHQHTVQYRIFYFSFFRVREGGAERGERRARQGEVVAGEWEQLLSCVTYCINLIHIALHFHQGIPFDYLVMACTRTALEIKGM